MKRWIQRLLAATGIAMAANGWAWTDKPVKLIVPAPAGGSMDVVARLLAQQLSIDIKQPVIIENKAGAGGSIGIQALLQAPADGQTLMVTSNNVLVEIPHVMKTPYDPLKDVKPIATFARSGLVLVSAPGASPMVFQSRNVSEARIYGAEFKAGVDFGALRDSLEGLSLRGILGQHHRGRLHGRGCSRL